jgi:hypothetical protein
MIVYNPRRCRGLVVLTSLHGWTAVGALPYAFFSSSIAIVFKIFPDFFRLLRAPDGKDEGEILIDHPYATFIFTSLLGFLLVFRGNLAYGRYWEARSQLQKMSVMWADLGALAMQSF